MPIYPLRNLPSIHELLERPAIRTLMDRVNRNAVVSTARAVLDEVRRELQTAASERTLPNLGELTERIARRVAEEPSPSGQPAINATGVLFRADLGAPPLADSAIAAMSAAACGFAGGGSPPHNVQAAENLLRELSGAEAAMVVGSHGGAILAAAAAMATGREVIASRGQLFAADGDVRLPEMIAAGGARLREVGESGVARVEDYEGAIGPQTAAILLIPPSGFLAKADAPNGAIPEKIAELCRQCQLPMVHFLDGGALADFASFGFSNEPTVPQSIRSGADLVIFPGQRLLGGPPCGILAGRKNLVEKIRHHPIAAALRPGKLTAAALLGTLQLYREPERAKIAVPTLRLLTTSVENLRNRAERLAAQADAAIASLGTAEAVADRCQLGDGPAQTPTWCVSLRPATIGVERLAALLSTATPSLIGRIRDDCLLLDLRSVLPCQDISLIAALESLAESTQPTHPQQNSTSNRAKHPLEACVFASGGLKSSR